MNMFAQGAGVAEALCREPKRSGGVSGQPTASAQNIKYFIGRDPRTAITKPEGALLILNLFVLSSVGLVGLDGIDVASFHWVKGHPRFAFGVREPKRKLRPSVAGNEADRP